MKAKESIGLYHLKNLRKFAGRDFGGMEVDFYRLDTRIAVVEDYGDGGGVSVSFTPEGRAYMDMVFEDIKRLNEELKPVLDKGSLFETFLSTPYSAVEGFTELLIELQEIRKNSDKVCKTVGENGFYIVGQMGNSWFKNDTDCCGGSTTIFTLNPQTTDFDKAREKMIQYAEKNKEKHGNLDAVAILQGKMDWNLHYKDYASLYQPYS